MIKTELKFKTLTPIWTGDADRKCTTIKDTSIIGSMRWWYEAIVRGMGGYACDPSNGGCEFNTKGYEAALKKGKSVDEALEIGLKDVCPACMLFGCTGWRRRFRLEVEDIDPVKLDIVMVDNLNWWLNTTLPSRTGFYSKESKLKLIFEDEITKKEILTLINLMESKASLGAKSQNGFGVFELISNIEVSDKLQLNPQVHEFIFLKLKLKSEAPDYLLTGFAVKSIIRKNLKKIQKDYLDVEKITHLVKNFQEVESYREKMRKFYQNKKQENKKYEKEELKYSKTSKLLARALFGSDLLSTSWGSRIEISHVYKKENEYYFRVICSFSELIDYYDNSDNKNGDEGKVSIKIDRLEVIKEIKNLLKGLPSDLPEIECVEILEGEIN